MIKIGVIGTGSMGKNHARVCSELPDVDLVGICDVERGAAKAVAKRFNTKVFSSYHDLLRVVDAVIVATPTSTHFDISNSALSSGKHVLVEKPICDTIKNAEDMVKKAENKNVVLATGHIERHNPAVAFVKESIQNNRFGEIISLSSQRVSNLPGRIRDVGVILDFGVHDIDVMRFLSGEVKSVYAKAGVYTKNILYEDHATILLNFENEVCGVVEVNWLTPIKIRKLFLTCSEQFVEMDYIDQSVTMSSSSFKVVDEMDLYHVPMQFTTNHIGLEKKEPLKNEIQDFIQAIKTNKKPLASGYDGLMALRIAQSALQSFRTGDVIKV
ncbi:MAG: Gfo/Idh/MocA family oxidoreductase [Candidatus Thermoplasmatota archaeon]|nr:Gfo/Idh/MocA family oxidoreductase [Candidatus Thermoplasmatota archaeon]